MTYLYGKVVAFVNGFYEIDAEDAPYHIRPLYLRQSQMLGAHVGCDVKLEYQTDHRSGLWNVIEITREAGGQS